MTEPTVTGHRFILTVDIAAAGPVQTFEDLLADIARDTAGRLTRMDFGLDADGNSNAVIRRTTVVKFGDVR